MCRNCMELKMVQENGATAKNKVFIGLLENFYLVRRWAFGGGSLLGRNFFQALLNLHTVQAPHMSGNSPLYLFFFCESP